MAAPVVADHAHRLGALPGAQAPGVYRPRQPRSSALYALLERRFRHLSLVYDERFARTYGPWRAVVPAVVDRFLARGILEHGFARIRCVAGLASLDVRDPEQGEVRTGRCGAPDPRARHAAASAPTAGQQ